MKNTFFISLYWILLIANVLANHFVWTVLMDSTKIFLMPALTIVLVINIENKSSRLFKWTSIALLFSWLGDILLIFQMKSDLFFLLGLGAFLIAHISYILDYWIARTIKPGIGFKSWIMPCMLLIIYLSFLFSGIGPGLKNYTIPVIFYALSISAMFLMAFSRWSRTTKQSFILVFLGACIFILSDSLIAINKFWIEFPTAGALIMFTYGIAQYMIIRGLIDHAKSYQ